MLGSYMFESCANLKTINLPKTLTTIGEQTFQNSGLESVTVPEGEQRLGRVFFMVVPILSQLVCLKP